jgi:hypothetical protein
MKFDFQVLEFADEPGEPNKFFGDVFAGSAVQIWPVRSRRDVRQ